MTRTLLVNMDTSARDLPTAQNRCASCDLCGTCSSGRDRAAEPTADLTADGPAVTFETAALFGRRDAA